MRTEDAEMWTMLIRENHVNVACVGFTSALDPRSYGDEIKTEEKKTTTKILSILVGAVA